MGKLSVSIDDQLEAELREQVGDAKVSPFVAEAVRNELARRRLGAFLEELDEELGPVDPSLLSEAREAFDEVEAVTSRRRGPKRPGSKSTRGTAKKASSKTTVGAKRSGSAKSAATTAGSARTSGRRSTTR